VGLDIRYARSGGVSIAYQAVGNGDVDLLYVPDYVSNLVYVLFGSHDGCSMAVLYAASYPERKRALVLFHSVAHDPEGDSEAARQDLARLRDSWGTQEYSDELLEQTEPSVAVDPDERQWFANWLRVGASPSVAYALNRAWFQTDLREILPSVRVPTLVLHRASFAEANALDVAGRIRGARAVRVSGTDYGSVYLSTEIPDEIEGFVAGEEAPAVPETVLTTVLGLEVRAGVHTGECELHEGKVAGVSVVIDSRVASLAEGGEVLVSQTVKDLVAGAGLAFTDRGAAELKGVPGDWRLYAVADG